MSDILIIKSTTTSFERYYNKQMQLKGADILDVASFYPATGRLGECTYYIKLLFNTSLRKKIRCYKKIVVFERADLIPILLTYKRKETKIVLWIWNTYSQQHPFYRKYQIASRLCAVYTMDRDFARGLDINSNCQFHFPDIFDEMYASEQKTNPKAYFIGIDKGRSSQLSSLSQELQSYGVVCNFQMIRDTTSPATFDPTLILEIPKLEDYLNVLHTVESSDIIVDLCKEGQTALTVRVLEAAIFGKKLITNNFAIKDELLYNSKNIFIIGYDKPESLPAFVNSPGVLVPREILNHYSYEAWIQGLFEEK